MEILKHCNLIQFEDIYGKFRVASFFIMLYYIALKLKIAFFSFFKWLCMGEWNICEAVSPTFISPYKETTTTVSFRFISTAKTEKTSWKTFQDIWLYIFEITIITSQFWNVKLYYFVTLKDMNNKLCILVHD